MDSAENWRVTAGCGHGERGTPLHVLVLHQLRCYVERQNQVQDGWISSGADSAGITVKLHC
jgi:hypothetical protein